MENRYRIHAEPAAYIENTVQYGQFRFTILTASMIRLEWNPQGIVTDMPSQIVWNRRLERVPYTYKREGKGIVLETEKLRLLHSDENQPQGLRIQLKSTQGDLCGEWQYGDRISTLKGTARTLDMADGAVRLEEGILSREGYSVLDDSSSYLIKADGELEARRGKGIDLYFMGYGHEYKKCLYDYLRLTGMPPMLPRFALGNWWSRYHRYSEEEYKELILRFAEEKIPLAVAMIDMDWHITEVDPAVGNGWTGYTWNRELFPNPKKFIDWLHEQGLKVSLNEHPADGIRYFEDGYGEMARAMGIDGESRQTVEFDVANPEFLEAYFKYLHEPEEKRGVDFWWVDWQQGEESRMPGLDPLWSLNHYHYLHNQRPDRRALILSRYAGAGSHRYPVGFSGDSIISWKSLAFQPYFTATASNIGYGWWSHDIGGHMLGVYDEQLQIRWIQFGVFSPICRIHSSASPFNHKEPWNYSAEAKQVITEYMRLRHKMLPYLYTMNELFSRTGVPLIRPMYYEYPEHEEAYQVPNEYFFGTQMLCLPITTPLIRAIRMAAVEAWIPEGVYIDWMSGRIYEGGRSMNLYRELKNMPVLLKAGAIIPLDGGKNLKNGTENPDCLEIIIAAGDHGAFEMYEDDEKSDSCQTECCVRTLYTLNYSQSEFMIHRPEGREELMLSERSYILRFLGFRCPVSIIKKTEKDEEELLFDYAERKKEVTVEITVPAGEKVCIKFQNRMELAENNVIQDCFELLDKAQIDFLEKEQIFDVIKKYSGQERRQKLKEKHIDSVLLEALTERMNAYRVNSEKDKSDSRA